ncbi:hypothetical protein DMENIID0001_016400 [Sergentomyia squamirostris]
MDNKSVSKAVASEEMKGENDLRKGPKKRQGKGARAKNMDKLRERMAVQQQDLVATLTTTRSEEVTGKHPRPAQQADQTHQAPQTSLKRASKTSGAQRSQQKPAKIRIHHQQQG